jgi:DNA-binding MarR family transcriptional regulator
VQDDELLQTAAAVRRGASRLARRLRLERSGPGETLLRLSVLGHLARRGPMSAGELANADRLQPQSLTRTLAGLEQEQLVTRQADQVDRRRSLLEITDAGLAVLHDDMRQRDSWLARAMTRQLTETECQFLRVAADLMERLAETTEAGYLAPGCSAPGC